jgi:hypothetical protein
MGHNTASFSSFIVCRPTYKGENKFGDYFRDIVSLQRVGDSLLKECTKERDSADVWTPNLVFVALKDSTSIFLA